MYIFDNPVCVIGKLVSFEFTHVEQHDAPDLKVMEAKFDLRVADSTILHCSYFYVAGDNCDPSNRFEISDDVAVVGLFLDKNSPLAIQVGYYQSYLPDAIPHNVLQFYKRSIESMLENYDCSSHW